MLLPPSSNTPSQMAFGIQGFPQLRHFCKQNSKLTIVMKLTKREIRLLKWLMITLVFGCGWTAGNLAAEHAEGLFIKKSTLNFDGNDPTLWRLRREMARHAPAGVSQIETKSSHVTSGGRAFTASNSTEWLRARNGQMIVTETSAMNTDVDDTTAAAATRPARHAHGVTVLYRKRQAV